MKTDAQIRVLKLPPGVTEKFIAIQIPEREGLCLRVRPSGKIWFFRWKSDGRKHKLTLGEYPEVTLATAAEKAKACRTRLKNGLHPKLPAAEPDDANLTVRQLFIKWRDADLCNRKDGGTSAQRLFENYVFDKLGNRLAADIRRRDVAELLDEARAKKVSRTVGLVLSSMRQMYRFGIDRELVETDPTAMLKAARFGASPVERDRVLSRPELVKLATQLRLSRPDALLPGEARLKDETKLALWLLLATGLRIGELLTLHWRDVDLKAGTATVRLEDSKKKLHKQEVFLSAFANARFVELAALTRRPGRDPGWCWPAMRKPDSPICIKTINKQINDRQRTTRMKSRSKAEGALALPNGKWTPHDLRRTASTLMGGADVPPPVIDKILNHREPNRVRRTYQHQQMEAQKKTAWATLGQLLEHIKDEADREMDIT